MPVTHADGFKCGECEALFEEPGGPVYECSRCGGSQVDERRCQHCNVFMAKVSDESCPSCESGESIEPVDVWMVDGAMFESEEGADQWIVDAPTRAADKAASDARLDQHMVAASAERVARRNALLPRLEAMVAGIDPAVAPDLHDTLSHTLEVLLVEDDGVPYQVSVPFEEMVRLKLGHTCDEQLAAVVDFSSSYEDREAAAKTIVPVLLPTLRTDEFRGWLNDPWFSSGGRPVLNVEVALDEFETGL